MRKITRARAIEKLCNTKGKIFFAQFVKKDGSLRRMTARLHVKKGVNGKGLKYDPFAYNLLPVFDMDKGAWRMINLSTVQRISLNHQRFKIIGP